MPKCRKEVQFSFLVNNLNLFDKIHTNFHKVHKFSYFFGKLSHIVENPNVPSVDSSLVLVSVFLQ